MPSPFHHDALAAWLAQATPATLLLLDPAPDALPADFALRHSGCAILHGDAQAPTMLVAADVAVVAHTLETLPLTAGRALLARLRDQLCGEFVALVPLGEDWPAHASHWSEHELLALGLSVRARYRDAQDRPWALGHYAIASYKTVPDWLNARFWAHPERWRP